MAREVAVAPQRAGVHEEWFVESEGRRVDAHKASVNQGDVELRTEDGGLTVGPLQLYKYHPVLNATFSFPETTRCERSSPT